MKPFRFWVQTALPLVYDDSLSYYELLCKVVQYINNMLKAIDEFNETIDEYTRKMDELVEYVHNYFESDEFHDMVIQALDDMAAQGDFDAIVEPIVQNYMRPVETTLTDHTHEISELTVDVRGLQNSITIINTKLGTVMPKIEYLENAMAAANGNIHSLEGSVQSLSAHLDTTDQNVGALSAEIDGLGKVWKLVAVAGTWTEGGTTQTLGNCMFLYNEDNAVIFDCGRQISGALLMASLTAHGVHNILGIVISHWHNDHINGLDALLQSNAFDFSNCKLFRPHHNINWNSFVGLSVNYQSIADASSALATAAGCTLVDPTEDYEANIDTLRLVFNNLSTAKFNNYYNVYLDEDLIDTGATQYNNFSMMCSVFVGNHKILFPGDIQPEAEAQNREVISGTSVYVIEHHGLNLKTDAGYLGGMAPALAIAGAYGTNHVNAMRLRYPTISKCSSSGAVFTTLDGEIVVNIGSYGVSCGSAGAEGYADDNFQNILASGTQLTGGTDFNNLTRPGIYTVQNATLLQQMIHAPAAATSGGKLLVMVASTSGAITQFYVCGNRSTPVVYARCFAVGSDGGWRGWKGLYPSVYKYVDLSTYGVNITVNTDRYRSRLWLQNGVLSFNIDFTSDVAINADTSFVNIPNLGLAEGYLTYFVLSDSAGTVYPCVCASYSDGSFQVWSLKNIPASVELTGGFSTVIYTDYPVQD